MLPPDHYIELYKKKIGKRIVKIRTDKGIKQVDLAYSLEIDDSSLRRIEAGRTNPTLKTLLNIAYVLNVSLEDLIKD